MGIFGALILVFQLYANDEFIQPENPHNILLFEFGITVLAAHFVVNSKKTNVGFLELFFTGYLCMLTILSVAAFIVWGIGLDLVFKYEHTSYALAIASLANVIIAFILSKLKFSRRVITDPEVIDDIDF